MSVGGGESASLRESSPEFLDYLDGWKRELPSAELSDLIAEAGGPEHVGIFCVDVIDGFCREGPLSSERVRGIVAPIADLFRRAHAAGVRSFVLPQDAHDPKAAEFAFYPPHCIRETRESRTVPELADLPYASEFAVFPKNSIHSAIGTGLHGWLESHPEVTHNIVVGDCTDLCTYHLATYLLFRANAANLKNPVILPVNCVDTYDVPVSVARENAIPAHPADILHAIFLYNMACNGVRVVSRIS